MPHDETFVCPHCGEAIDRRAKACPRCGSDEETGWSDKVYLDGIDLSDGDDYEEIRQSEFEESRPSWTNKAWVAVTAAVVVGLFLLGVFAALR
jgi:hypothetical protein